MWLQDWFLLLPSGSTEHRFPVRRGVETLDGTLTRSALQWERKGWNSGDITRPCGISAVGRLEAIRGELLRCCHLALHPQHAYFAYLHAYFDIVRIFTRIFRHFLKLSNIKIKKNRKKSQLRAALISGMYMGWRPFLFALP